jgi:hypothetical protein
MERFPDITIQDPAELNQQLAEDLEAINDDEAPVAEDLNSTPFVQEPHNPEEPQLEKAKPIKPKKPISDKQRQHLENMREKARIKKAQTKAKKANKDEEHEAPENIKMKAEVSDFDSWMSHMEKFNNMMSAVERRKAEESERKRKEEEAIEAKYRAKFEAEQKAKHIEQARVAKLTPPREIISRHDDYGEYSNYF